MNIKEILISEIENTPEPVLSEVLDFVFFKKKNIGKKWIQQLSVKHPWKRTG